MKPSAPAELNRAARVPPRLAHDRRGGAALEFALISPLLIVMIFGTIEVARALHSGATVQWAMERVARRAMVDPQATHADLQALADEVIAEAGGGIEVTLGYAVSEESELRVARLSADYVHEIHVPLIPAFNTQFTVDTFVPLPNDE